MKAYRKLIKSLLLWVRISLGTPLLLLNIGLGLTAVRAAEVSPELEPFKPLPAPIRPSRLAFDQIVINISEKELERMAGLDSYRISIGGQHLDLMKAVDAIGLERLFLDSRTDRSAYQGVARIPWLRMWELKTNLTSLADFPGPMPTQLRVHAERILMAMTNSPAVSFPLRGPVLMRRAGVQEWQIGNLNAIYPEDMKVLIEELRTHPAEGMTYVEGLLTLFDSAKGYLGPSTRKTALEVYLGFPVDIKADLKAVLAGLSDDDGLGVEIRRAAQRAARSLETIWAVVLNGKRYDLNTIEGVEAFIEEGNARTHFMDHLVVIGTIMVEGAEHPEVREVASWLATNAPPRLHAFLHSHLVRGDGMIAREAHDMLRVMARAEGRVWGTEAEAGETNAVASVAMPVEVPTLGTVASRARRWISGHMEIVAGVVLLVFAAFVLPQVLSEVKLGKQRLRRRTLYAVADEVMGVLKMEASRRLERIDGQMLDLQRDNESDGEQLNRRLLELQEQARGLKSVAEIGKEPDKCPAPQEVVKVMKGIGVDIGKVVDGASKHAVTSWEARYQLNRNADLVIAAYYKKHFNRFIDLVQQTHAK